MQAAPQIEFGALVSCGKCTPCRVGWTRGMEVIDRGIRNDNRVAKLILLEDLYNTLKFGSFSALDVFTPYAVMSALHHSARRRLQAAE